jgi:hypothetical protein
MIRILLAMSIIFSQTAFAAERTYLSVAIERMTALRKTKEYVAFKLIGLRKMIDYVNPNCPKTSRNEQVSLTEWTAMNDFMGMPFAISGMPRNNTEKQLWVAAYWKATNQLPQPASDAFISVAPISGVVLLGVLNDKGCFVDLQDIKSQQYEIFRKLTLFGAPETSL